MENKLHELESRVLLYAPSGKDALLASRVLASADIVGVPCTTLADVFDELDRGAGALLTIEETLTPAALKLLGDWIERQAHWSDIPVLVVTHQGADSPRLQSVMASLRNLTLLERPIRTRALISAVQSALRARHRQYQAREAEHRKDEFLASLAHELRNPLAPIRTSIGVLSMMYPGASGVTKVCDVVERQIGHLTRLVDDLLDVARITSGKIVLQREPVALSDVIAHSMEICTSLHDGKSHRIDVTRPPVDVMLDADQVRLVQSVANVLGNAIKFTPPPGKISFSTEVEGNVVCFRVKDSGIGLDAGAAERIFEMFAQGNAFQSGGRGTGGLGIGLSLAKRFIEMHGGKIAAHSAGHGKGSEFVITLPVVTGPAKPKEKQVDATSPLPRGGKRHVLVVDDNRDGADMLQRLFEADGYMVAAAYDGVEAVEAVRKNRPDAVIMDIGMPRMDGYEAVRRIRELPGGQDVLMIALTGWGQESARRQAEEAGFDHHLVKPVNFDLLRQFLERALQA